MSQVTNSRTLTPKNTPFKSSYQVTTRTPIFFPDQGRTKQSFKDECDVNRIMALYLSTGQMPNINEIAPQYLDVTGMDFQEHQNFIIGAQDLFSQIPSNIRSRFDNDPGRFLDFCSNPDNRSEMAQMGLLRDLNPPVVPLASLQSSNPLMAPKPDSQESPKTA